MGNLGDIVTVKNGYARNFLIPAGKAKRATEANMKEFEARRAELEAKQAEILADAQARQEKLDGQTITVAQKQVWTAVCLVPLPMLTLRLQSLRPASKLPKRMYACQTVL